ncbi:polynucleotide adenylyltransferase PcnB [Inhella crocodyli]|uniref:Poly(A) polymerase I n=1 Tax=Inhella crocodyli TaxID=2499851 RepID=A0A3S2UXT4_9BURK|nr:polynucleotide adenylyltransferase PcnB [Inhella crocodyli]RVT87638.1 polynucleotide adenylyltransferase PcnB [Inhella crocodyli]
MIKKFINRLLGKDAAKPVTVLGTRTEVGVAEHGIDPSLLDERATRVVKTLQEAGFEAYIVGGAVRDLLLGRRPKDFDVATNATPEQVKSLFKRAFIIGRRFRIVHVVYGRGREHEVIEVSTFRALLTESSAQRVTGNEKTSKSELAGKSHVVDESGRVLRDNVWGPQVEDAARRDFTINAMYYDPARQMVVDYHGGLKDIRAKLLRMIGDPETRYREDPVRILRVVRFAAKLGFAIEPATRAPIVACAKQLPEVPISRLFDEMVKLLQTGHGLASLETLKAQGLGRGLFPVLDAVLQADGSLPEGPRGAFVRQALQDTDARVADGRSVAPSFLLACLLWHEVKSRWQALRAKGEPPVPALQQAIDQVFDARVGDISGRGKLAADMREIWLMQPRFERRGGSGPYGLVEQPRYRAGFDFLRLRADVGDADPALADWWEDFALGSDDDRAALIEDAKAAERQVRQHRATAPSGPEGDEAAGPEPLAGPAKKRRRRRRPSKGRGDGGAGEPGAAAGGA